MKATVYLETTLVSYLVGRPSDNLIVAAHQELTRQWWTEHLRNFRGVISRFVLDEVREGDPVMVRLRLAELSRFESLPITDGALRLGRALLATGIFPAESSLDASHIAMAAAHKVHFLATWNCRHLANARAAERVRKVCQTEGFACPVICTPEELMELEP